MKRRLLLLCLSAVLLPSTTRAELRQIELTIFGMD